MPVGHAASPTSNIKKRAASSAGRALRSQCRGQEFDPPAVHQPSLRCHAKVVRDLRATVGKPRLRSLPLKREFDFPRNETSSNRNSQLDGNQRCPDGGDLATNTKMPPAKRLVYVLGNLASPPRYYTGLTCDVAVRLAAHNAGRSPHTAKHRPWNVDLVVEFPDEERAVRFERYLKSGSGCAFAKRHLR